MTRRLSFRPRTGVPALLTAALVTMVTLAVPSGLPTSPATAAPVRIMPLGDSITAGSCWRAMLWDELRSAGYTNLDFVGTQPGGGCGIDHDGDNEGHGGFHAYNIAAQNQLTPWLEATDPDIVLVHLGTNDIWNRRPTADIIEALGTLVDQMRRHNPTVTILMAQIIPVAPTSGCPECAAATVDLNNAILELVEEKSVSASSRIYAVDLWNDWDPSVDASDGVHTTSSGDRKMADRWFAALSAVLGDAPLPRPGLIIPSPGATVPADDGSGGCTAVSTVGSSWSGGFVATVTVTAGSSAVGSWRVAATLPDGVSVGNSWGAEPDGTSGEVGFTGGTAEPLAAGTSTSFGFQASGSPTGLRVVCSAD
jgi:lysophospholipase L1-like esterase